VIQWPEKRSTYSLYRYGTLDERQLGGDDDFSPSSVYNNISQEKTGFKCHLLPVGMRHLDEISCDVISITHKLLFMDEMNYIRWYSSLTSFFTQFSRTHQKQ
jgi:hypothetical protein